jgi:hypothetical protein
MVAASMLARLASPMALSAVHVSAACCATAGATLARKVTADNAAAQAILISLPGDEASKV